MSIPVMLRVDGRKCLVVGGGPVGRRKAKQLRDEGADVVLISRTVHEEIDGIACIEGVYSKDRLFEAAPWLVIAATNDWEVNRQVQADAEEAGILTMLADNPREADVQGMMQREKGGVRYMVTTGNPLLSRLMLDRAEALITPAIMTFGEWLSALREPSKDIIAEQADRAALWRDVMASDVLGLLEEGQVEAAREALVGIVGEQLGQYLPGNE